MDLRESYTKKPKVIPANNTLKFGHEMTDHMLEINYTVDRGWGKPVIGAYHPLSLDPAAKCLHYSLEVGVKLLFYYLTDNG